MKGIFGGTFDPVHYGHLRAASEAMERLAMTDLRLLPAGTPPHRHVPLASAEQRLEMLRLALSGHPDLWVDDREIRRSGKSYMVDTLKAIRLEEGDIPLLLVIGQDAANSLDTWHRWHELFVLAHIVIMRRPDSGHAYSGVLSGEIRPRSTSDPSQLQQAPAGLVYSMEITQLAISSTDIRQQFEHGDSPRFLLPDSVIRYVLDHGLYGSGQAG